VIVVENHTQSIAAPTTAPMTGAYPLAAAPSRRMEIDFVSRLLAIPAVGVTAHATGQVSFADANAVFSKVWAPPPRREPL
jgi:hypothetical protein